jgi:hypothetical protein
MNSKELSAEIAVIGGGTGGVAAALAAARCGRRVILTEETDWIGGQLTQQAVPPDEHPWIESFGCTRSYREFRDRVRDHYRRNYRLTASARSRWNLNPGNGGVSRLCHEPRVALAVLQEMLAPYLSSGRVTLLLHHKAVSAEVEGDRVTSVKVRSLLSGDEIDLTAPFILDATEKGDLLPMTGTEYVVGAESQGETGEMHAPAEANPANHQAFTVCFAMDYREGEDHVVDPPDDYAFWRDYLPDMTPAWPGPLLSLAGCHPITLERRDYLFDPPAESEGRGSGLWTYRRILDKRNLEPGEAESDICLVNWPMNDYWLGNLIDVPEEEANAHLERGKGLSLSLLHWLQTEAPRPDGGTGWRGLRLRPDVTGTEDGLAKHPYIRESRRIRSLFTILERHVGAETRRNHSGLADDRIHAAEFYDSVGVGSYRIDLHPSTGRDNYIDVSSLPFQIPLGALIPIRIENLLPASKNLGVTHITNGCYRLHPVEWNIGEASGMLAAHCLRTGRTPKAVRENRSHLQDFQNELRHHGFELEWPHLRPL